MIEAQVSVNMGLAKRAVEKFLKYALLVRKAEIQEGV